MTLRLSPLMQEIVDVIGLKAAIKLVDAKGGQRIWLPVKIEPGFWLAEMIGLDKAGALTAYFNHETGNHLDLPSRLSIDLADKERRFRAMVAAGMSTDAIAGAAGITRRRVFQKKQDLKIKPAQRDMFDDETPAVVKRFTTDRR